MLWYHPVHSSRLVSSTPSTSLSRSSHSFHSLTTWLSHSKKKTCDLCKHPYTFTKGELGSLTSTTWVVSDLGNQFTPLTCPLHYLLCYSSAGLHSKHSLCLFSESEPFLLQLFGWHYSLGSLSGHGEFILQWGSQRMPFLYMSLLQDTKNYPVRGGLVVVSGPQMSDQSESSQL